MGVANKNQTAKSYADSYKTTNMQKPSYAKLNHQQDNEPQKVQPIKTHSMKPQTGMSLSKAYFATVSTLRNDSTLSNKDSSRPQATALVEGAAAKAREALEKQNDFGSDVAGGIITTGVVGYQGFKLAQKASPIVIDAVKNVPNAAVKTTTGIVKVGKGAWDVTTTLGKASVTVARTTTIMRSGFIPFTPKFTKAVLVDQARRTGLLYTATSKRIINGVHQIQRTYANTKKAVITTARSVKTGVVKTTRAVKRSFTIIRNIPRGSLKAVVPHDVLLRIGRFAKKSGLRGLKCTTKGITRVGVKGAAGVAWAAKKSLPISARGIKGLSNQAAGALAASDDMILQGIGKGSMLAKNGIKTSVTVSRMTGRAAKTSVKVGVNTTKNTYKAVKFIHNNGLKVSWNKARQKISQSIAKAGKSLVSAMINIVKAVGNKVVVPIVLIAVGTSAAMSILSAPVGAISGIFSGLFDKDNGDGTYTETDIRAFITDSQDGIPAKREEYIDDLVSYLDSKWKSNGGEYDYVRLKTNQSDEVIEPTRGEINAAFYSVDDLSNMIQPIFNAVILQKYDLAPTDKEAKDTVTEIFNKLFKQTEAVTIEQCGQNAKDGKGTPDPPCSSCGQIHARPNCPNHNEGNHSSHTCESCCYKTCSGHTSTDADGKESTYKCGGCTHACKGYDYCGGHKVITVTLNMDGLYQLLNEYFEDPINRLSSIPNRTEEQELELSKLKDSYEICLELIKQVTKEFGGGLTAEDFSGVKWINGERNGNQEIIDIALGQVGQVGGQPYWSWYGYNSRVEWCACFVSWCMNEAGHGEVRYSACQAGGIPYFSSIGQYALGGYKDLVAGDVIFFDWNNDGRAQHTGLVIGTDGEYVYTVEGNSGDVCKAAKYRLDSSVILGYGLMNY